jgi:hypothetical protein
MLFFKELCLLPVEREVIKHRHLQSPLTQKYITSNSSADLRSLLSPMLELKHIQLASWDSAH